MRNMFNFPFHLVLSSLVTPDEIMPWSKIQEETLKPAWQFDGWLLLSAVACVVLGLWGRAQDGRLAGYYFLLWFLALAWNTSMLVILALTYSEFFMSTPRILYLFSYLVIADALVVGLGRLQAIAGLTRRGLGYLRLDTLTRRATWITASLCALAMLTLGMYLQAWQSGQGPPAGAHALSVVLSLLMPLAVLKGVVLPSRLPATGSPGAGVLLAIAAFFVPFLAHTWKDGLQTGKYADRPEIHWFEAGNPCGLSPEVIAWATACRRGSGFSSIRFVAISCASMPRTT